MILQVAHLVNPELIQYGTLVVVLKYLRQQIPLDAQELQAYVDMAVVVHLIRESNHVVNLFSNKKS